MGFVTNQNVAAGTELCISYVEHDVLCEPAWRRNMMLSMDFTDHDDDAAAADDDNNNDVSGGTLENSKNSKVGGVLHRNKGPDMPVVDSDVQNELMSMDPFARLSAIDELMLQAVGEKRPENEQEEEQIEQGSAMEMTGGGGGGDSNDNGNDSDIIPWFQCDVHNLRILKAITLDGLGQTADALKLWEESVAFVEQKLPPLDESLVVLRAQAALCAWQAPGSQAVARHHAASALQAHCLLFGGGVARFRRRLDRDLNLALRPTAVTGSGGGDDSTPSSTVSPADILWPVVS